MHQAHSDLNANATAGRKNRRHPYTLAAGLIAVAIATVVVVEERSASTSSDGGIAAVAPLVGTVMEDSNASTGTVPSSDTAGPHFQRSEEPANDDDATHPHGG